MAICHRARNAAHRLYRQLDQERWVHRDIVPLEEPLRGQRLYRLWDGATSVTLATIERREQPGKYHGVATRFWLQINGEDVSSWKSLNEAEGEFLFHHLGGQWQVQS